MAARSAQRTRRTKSPLRRVFSGLFYLLYLAVFLAIGAAVGYVRQSPVLASIFSQRLRNVKPQEIFHKQTLTVLILGCDENLTPGGAKVLNDSARSDMLLLTRFDFARQSVTGLSIPRDIYFKLPGYEGHKMNAFHAVGGNALSQIAVSQMLGVPIDRTLSLDFDAFQELVNLVGGVTVDVTKRMHWVDQAGGLYIDLKPGVQKLNGYNAMGFVRFRHSDSDFARQERQRQFLMAFKDQVASQPWKIDVVTEKAMAVLGNEFSPPETASLALFVTHVPKANINLGAVPVKQMRGTTALRVDEEALPDVLRTYHFTRATESATNP